MFTGIIEEIAEIESIDRNENIELWVKSGVTNELKIDQSVAHNGICLTVVEKRNDCYRVTAVEETIKKSTMSEWKKGDYINIERGLMLPARLDGHIVQGHVDSTGMVKQIVEKGGSWIYTISYSEEFAGLLINKGSITIDGVSLTVINPSRDQFSVTIIPFTYEHTIFRNYYIDHRVNLEFDILGKYFVRNLALKNMTV